MKLWPPETRFATGNIIKCPWVLYDMTLFQYSIRRLIVRSRKVSKPRDLYLELADRSEIWQEHRQHCCWCACQISERCDNLNYQYRGFETSRDLTVRRLIGYWNGALDAMCLSEFCWAHECLDQISVLLWFFLVMMLLFYQFIFEKGVHKNVVVRPIRLRFVSIVINTHTFACLISRSYLTGAFTA